MKKLAIGIAATLILGVLAATPVSATCATANFFYTYKPGTGTSYLLMSSGSDQATTVIGRFWQPGQWNPVHGCGGTTCGNDSGLCDDVWLFGSGAGTYMNGAFANCEDGCPVGRLIVLAENSTGSNAEFVAMSTAQDGTGDYDFYTAKPDNYPAVTVPNPKVMTSSRVVNTVNLTVDVNSAQSGVYSDTSFPLSYKILTKFATADPGRLPATYSTLVASVTPGTAVPASINCAAAGAGEDAWLVTQLAINGVDFAYASAPTRVKCNSNLADPKFKAIDKQPTGSKILKQR